MDIQSLCHGCMAQNENMPQPCPHCGFDSAAYAPAPHQLPPDTILHGRYLLGRAIGEGGFGITYIGWDLALDLKVAIKEFYPTGFVTRETAVTETVQPFAGTQGDFFAKGRSHFVEEAKNLARFSASPGIVSVRDFFLENGTAYIVMEYIEGRTFKEYLQDMGGRLPPLQVFEMMLPIMRSLAETHRAGLIHRDISPDNMMITHDGYMKLLDFGAAKEFEDSGNKSLSVMLKPGFSPEEQYRSRGVQGPWTDVYALCATMYRAVTGEMPPESMERLRKDELKPPSRLGVAIRPDQEAALLKGMAVLQEERWQDMGELMRALELARTMVPAPVPVPAGDGAAAEKKTAALLFDRLPKKLLPLLAGALVLVIAVCVAVPLMVNRRRGASPAVAATRAAQEESQATATDAVTTEAPTTAEPPTEPPTTTASPTTVDDRVYVTKRAYTASNFVGKSIDGQYTGYWKNGQPDDPQGKFDDGEGGYYVGPWKNGLPHGEGKYIEEGFGNLTGNFKAGSLDGYVSMTASDEDMTTTVSGTWSNNRLTYANIRVKDSEGNIVAYVGSCVIDIPKEIYDASGKGTITYEFSGEKYVGEVRDGQPHGAGTSYDKNGNVAHSGTWNNGDFVG